MSNSTVNDALTHVTDVLSSSDYSEKEVVIIIPNILLENEAATQKYIRDFNKISSYSLAHEPETLKFGAFRPRNSGQNNQIFALEHFESETALAKHREAAPVQDMLFWLMNDKPNGSNPLPYPIPLQIMAGSFTRSAMRETSDPFIVITHIVFEAGRSSDVEAELMEFGKLANRTDDVLVYLPGKTGKDCWVVAAYMDRQTFEKVGLVEKRFAAQIVQSWDEHILELSVGFLARR